MVLINNNSGSMVEMLPIANFNPPFEEFFATAQDVDFGQMCATYGIEHRAIASRSKWKELLNPLPDRGIRVLELRTNRKMMAVGVWII